MTTVDVILAILVGVLTLIGLFSGVVRLALLLLAWGGAMVIADLGRPFLRPLLLDVPILGGLADPASLIISFILALIVLIIVADLLRRLLEGHYVGVLSRILGCMLGSLLAVTIVTVSYAALVRLVGQDDMPSWIMEAKARPAIERIVNIFTPFLSESQGVSPSITSPPADIPQKDPSL